MEVLYGFNPKSCSYSGGWALWTGGPCRRWCGVLRVRFGFVKIEEVGLTLASYAETQPEGMIAYCVD
jgi:hypothetical protein